MFLFAPFLEPSNLFRYATFMTPVRRTYLYGRLTRALLGWGSAVVLSPAAADRWAGRVTARALPPPQPSTTRCIYC